MGKITTVKSGPAKGKVNPIQKRTPVGVISTRANVLPKGPMSQRTSCANECCQAKRPATGSGAPSPSPRVCPAAKRPPTCHWSLELSD